MVNALISILRGDKDTEHYRKEIESGVVLTFRFAIILVWHTLRHFLNPHPEI